MKVIVAGTRTFDDYTLVEKAIEVQGWEISEVVCGGARGVDTLGAQWAGNHGIPVKHFPADWDTHGKSAGPIRNEQMAKYADALVLVWDGESKESANMKKNAEKYNLPICEVVVTTEAK